MSRRVVHITGAGMGIGRATALAFAKLGDFVVVTDILEQEGEAVVRDNRGGRRCRGIPQARCEGDGGVGDIEARPGAIDVIVPNAGIAHKAPVDERTDAR